LVDSASRFRSHGQMKCPQSIRNLAKAIYTQSSRADGIEWMLSRVQRDGFKGIHILRYSHEGEYTRRSEPEISWLYDGVQLRKVPYPGAQVFKDGISSDFPRLSFCKLAEKKYAISYVTGPRAARAMTAYEEFSGGKVYLTIRDGDTMMVS